MGKDISRRSVVSANSIVSPSVARSLRKAQEELAAHTRLAHDEAVAAEFLVLGEIDSSRRVRRAVIEAMAEDPVGGQYYDDIMRMYHSGVRARLGDFLL